MCWDCPSCADSFDGKRAVTTHHLSAHGEAYYDAKIRELYSQSAEGWLVEQYHKKGKSLSEVGELLGCGSSTVRRMMERFGLETRMSNQDKPPWFGVDSQGYESFRHNFTDGMVEIRHHRLLAISEYGVEEVVENDVHHKNGIPWDNRPENLELLDHSEHRRQHRLEEIQSD